VRMATAPVLVSDAANKSPGGVQPSAAPHGWYSPSRYMLAFGSNDATARKTATRWRDGLRDGQKRKAPGGQWLVRGDATLPNDQTVAEACQQSGRFKPPAEWRTYSERQRRTWRLSVERQLRLERFLADHPSLAPSAPETYAAYAKHDATWLAANGLTADRSAMYRARRPGRTPRGSAAGAAEGSRQEGVASASRASVRSILLPLGGPAGGHLQGAQGVCVQGRVPRAERADGVGADRGNPTWTASAGPQGRARARPSRAEGQASSQEHAGLGERRLQSRERFLSAGVGGWGVAAGPAGVFGQRANRKKYGRAVLTVAGSNTAVCGVILQLKKYEQPVTNDPATVVV